MPPPPPPGTACPVLPYGLLWKQEAVRSLLPASSTLSGFSCCPGPLLIIQNEFHQLPGLLKRVQPAPVCVTAMNRCLIRLPDDPTVPNSALDMVGLTKSSMYRIELHRPSPAKEGQRLRLRQVTRRLMIGGSSIDPECGRFRCQGHTSTVALHEPAPSRS